MILYGKNFIIFDRLEEDIGKYRHILPYKVQTSYIPLDDDTLIAADIITEKGSLIKRPTFLQLGYRWSETEDEKRLNPFIQEGFNLVKIDVRGTGASSGTRTLPWSKKELDDFQRIIEWIIHQAWSDGHIITFGVDYASTTSELAASLNNKSIKATIVFGNAYDLFSEMLFPGGLFLESFVSKWSLKNAQYEKTKIKPVKDPLYQPVISEIKQQHQSNTDVYELFSVIDYSDEALIPDPEQCIKKLSVSQYSDEISRNKSPKFICGSWFDGKTAESAIHRFMNYSGPLICVIGSWDHQLRPIKPLIQSFPSCIPSQLTLYLEYIRFAKKAITNPSSIPKLLYYFTVGQQRWKVTDTWPLPNTQDLRFYLCGNHKLNSQQSDSKGSKTDYRIDFSASIGKNNRWTTYFGNPIDYRSRKKQDKRLLTFTSAPITEPVEITGHPIVTIHLSSTHGDGELFIYLEAIYKRKIYYLSEGQIRLIYYKEAKQSKYKTPIIYRNFTKSEASALRENLIYDIHISLEPISIQLPAGTKIRLAIAGADAGNFKLFPKEKKPIPLLSIYHNSEYPSLIQLPTQKILTE